LGMVSIPSLSRLGQMERFQRDTVKSTEDKVKDEIKTRIPL